MWCCRILCGKVTKRFLNGLHRQLEIKAISFMQRLLKQTAAITACPTRHSLRNLCNHERLSRYLHLSLYKHVLQVWIFNSSSCECVWNRLSYRAGQTFQGKAGYNPVIQFVPCLPSCKYFRTSFSERGKDLAWGTLHIKFLLPTEKQIPFHPDEYEWFLWNCQEYSEYVFFFRVLSTFMFLALAIPVITFPHHGPVTTRFRKSQWSVTVNLAQVVINSLETLLEIKENWSNLSPNHCWLGAFWKACCILWRSNKGCYVDP